MEFVLAMWGNGRSFVVFLAVASAVVAVVTHIYAAMLDSVPVEKDDKARAASARKLGRRALPVFVVLGLIACVPTIDDLWRARIAIVKYQLAAPENVKAASETIERIGKKLECKYLGGKDCTEAQP